MKENKQTNKGCAAVKLLPDLDLTKQKQKKKKP